MNTQRIVQVLLILLLTVSLIPKVHAIEPAWIYPMNNVDIGNIAVSYDGSTIIVAAGDLWIFSRDGTLIKKEPFGESVVITPDGRYAASFFGSIIYFFRTPLTTGSPDPKQLNMTWEYNCPDHVRSLDITEDGSTIGASTTGNVILIISTSTQNVASSDLFPNTIFGMPHSGWWIAGISADTIRVYNSNAIVTGTYNTASVSQPDVMVLSQTIPLMVFNDGQKIRGFDLSTGTNLWTVRATGKPISLAMTPSGSSTVAGTENGNIDLYNDQGELVWSHSSDNDGTLKTGITAVALSKDGGVVAAGSADGRILLLGAGGNLLGSYQAEDPVRYITVSWDGSIVLATDKKNLYAFYTAPSSQSSSSPVSYYQFNPKNLSQGSLNASGQNITSSQNPALQSGNPAPTPAPVRATITELPTTYSIIRTPTQSPVSPIIPLMGIVVAVLLLVRRR